MSQKRYITVQAVLDDNELIPLWDKRVKVETINEHGYDTEVITINGDQKYNIVDCIFDIKTKKLSHGIELDSYPSDLEFEIGQEVFIEAKGKNRELEETKIIDIVFDEFEYDIIQGYKMEKWYLKRFENITIDKKTIYAIKKWKPKYILENGRTTMLENHLYRKKAK